MTDKSKPHTLTSAQRYLAVVAPDFRLLRDSGNDYAVKKFGAKLTDPSTYFTNDLQDAIDTALDMQERLDAPKMTDGAGPHERDVPVGWAKGNDLDPNAFYVIGIMRGTRELIITAGPYEERRHAWLDAGGQACNNPEYSTATVLPGSECKGLRTWEDLV